MNRFPFAIVFSIILSLVAPALGQETPHDPFEELRERFNLLSRSLTNQRGLSDRDKPFVLELRDQARDYAHTHAEDARPWAMVAQLSSWLKDDAALDEAYDRLGELRPDDIEFAALVARRLMGRSQYAEAAARLEPHVEALKTDARNAQLLGQAYFALDRFEDALNVLAALQASSPAEQVRMDVLIKPDIEKYTRYVSYWNIERELRDAENQRNDLPRVQLITSDGSVVLELFEDSVPNTVANFISLVESGFYDGIRFHRVIPDYMSQAGDPREREGSTATTDDPGYHIADENLGTDKQRRHFRGSIAMANKDRPDTGGSEFYITHKPNDFLDGRKVVFGRVIEGMDVVVGMTEREDLIISARVLRKRDHDYEPLTIALPPSAPPSSASEAGSVDPPAGAETESEAASADDMPPGEGR